MTERKRKTNGQGYTYKAGNSYRTVIRRNGIVVTAMAKTEQESKRLAKFKLSQEPNIKVDSPISQNLHNYFKKGASPRDAFFMYELAEARAEFA